MLPILDSDINKFLSGNPKTLTLKFDNNTTLTNEDIIQESMTLTQTITDTQNFSLGQVFSTEFRIKIFNDGTSYAGKWFNVTIESSGASLNIGRFKVESEKTSDDRIYKDIVAYDLLRDILNADYAEWHNSLSFPMTLGQYLGRFSTHAGFSYSSSEGMANSTMQVNETFITSGYSGADVFRCILELSGHFVHVRAINNSLYFRPVNPIQGHISIPNDQVLLGGFKREDFVTTQITGIHIRTIDGLTSGSYSSWDDPAKTYYIANNPLVSGKTSAELKTIAKNILPKINQLFFRPYTLNCVGLPWMEVGDAISLYINGQSYFLPIFNRVLTGINALRDTYTANGTKRFTQAINSGNITVQTVT